MNHSTLYLRLSESDELYEWLLLGSDGRCRTGCSTLDDVATETLGARLVVVIPATTVTIARVALPPIKRTQQYRAALFAIEDQLADDPVGLHAALGVRDEHGTIPLVVVNRTLMNEWLARLAVHHLRPEQVVVDVLTLPVTEGTWTLLWEDDEILLRTGVTSGVSFRPEQWSLFWPRLLKESGEALPERLLLLDGRRNAKGKLQLDDVLPDGSVEYQDVTTAMQWLKDGTSDAYIINLLQGDYGRREQWGRLLRPWRPAATLLLIWLSLQGGMALFDRYQLRHEELRLEQQMTDLYRTTFPDARKVVDPVAQMKQRLAAAQSGDHGFMAMVADAAQALSESSVQMKGMRYQDGELNIDISVIDMAALDKLRGALLGKGLNVDIGDTSTRDGRVESRLTIHGGSK